MNDQSMGSSEAPLEVLAPSAVEAVTRAEVDISIATARKYPRELARVKAKMMSFATLDEETAESCFYSLPRGGKLIQGPSVRLAEIAASCYGNLRAGSRIIQSVVNGENPHVVVQAIATDLENNITVSMEKRRRITKKKSKLAIDEDDINLATNACSAIAFRDAIYKIVPLALIKPVFEQAKAVAIGTAKSLVQRRARAIEKFSKIGVTTEQLLAKVEKKTVEEIELSDLEVLFGLFTAIKDGQEGCSIEEIFAPVRPATKAPEIPGQPKPPTQETKKTAPAVVTSTTPPAQQPSTNAPQDNSAKEKVEPSDEEAEAAAGLAPASQTQTTTTTTITMQVPTPAPAEPATQSEPAAPFVPNSNESDELQNVRLMMHKNGVSEPQVMNWAHEVKLAKPEQRKLTELSTAKYNQMLKTWPNILPKIKEQPAF